MNKRLPIQFIFFISFLLYFNHQIIAQQRERLAKKIDSLISLVPKLKEDSIKAETIRGISTGKMDLAQHTGNWDDPIEWTHKALNLSIKTKYRWGIGRCQWQLGICWMKKSNYPEAIKWFSEGVKTAFKNENKNLVLACNLFMGNCYMSLGNYQEVIKVSLSAIETIRQMNLPETSEELHAMQIGNAYAKLSNYPEALNWFEKVHKKHKSVAEDQILISIASMQMEMKNYDGALKNYLTALQILSSDKKLNEKPQTEYNGLLGQLYMQIGEVYFKIGSLTQDTTSIRSAINYLNKSLPLLTGGAGGHDPLINVYALLKQACETTKDYQNALYFTNLYNGLRDSIYNKTTYLKIADLQVKYETEKADAALKIKQEKEKLLNVEALTNQKLEQEKKLTDERIANEKAITKEIFEKEKAIETEKANSEKLIATEKAKQEKLRTEKRQINNLLSMSLGLVVITFVFIILYLRQRNQKKRAVERAETIHKLAELEMQSLRSQLNPHFMFNSLNSIQTLILKEDNDRSQSYLSRFARLLRMLLENADAPFIPLRKEIEFLQLYLSLESLRVPDLQYSFSTDPKLDTEQTLIPNMFLQPYVENAIWHGLSHKDSDKQIQIRIFRENGTVTYEIEDNGVGRQKAEELKSLFRKQHQSKGMELLNKRIKLLNKEYSSTIQTEITDVIKNNEVKGTLVIIKVPVMLSEPLQVK